MKNQSFLSLLFWAFFVLAIGSACQTKSDIEVDPPLSTTVAINLEVTSTSTLMPSTTTTITPTPLSSATPTVPPTNTPSPTATNTPTPSLTPIFSPVATLSTEQEGVLLSKLMATNGGCMLPCWWGITPGLTHEDQARNIFELHGINAWTTSFDGTYALLGLGYPRKDSSVEVADINMRFQLDNDAIQYIDIDSGYRQEEFREFFIRDWQLYEPDKILRNYGLPEYIEFAQIENSPYYRLIFSYPLRGVEINYIVPFELIETDKIKVCFDLAHVDFIALSLYPSNQMDNAPENIIPKRLSTYVSWEETSGLTMEAFRQVFDNSGVLPCIELSLEP